MMPPPRQNKTCVENIKKKFECINQPETGNPSFNKNLSAKTQLSRGGVEDESNPSIIKSDSPRKRKSPVGGITHASSEASLTSSSPIKIVPLKVERQLSSPTSRNIRRSPAFRCDKVVRARNIIAQSACRDTPKSVVVRRVKQFDNQSVTDLDSSAQHNSNHSVSSPKPVVAWRSKLKSDSTDTAPTRLSKLQDVSHASPAQKNDVEIQKKTPVSGLSTNISNLRKTETDCSAIGSGQRDSSDSTPFKNPQLTVTSQERPSRKLSRNADRFDVQREEASKENGDKTSASLETGKSLNSDQGTRKSMLREELTEAVKAAMESPLPAGPPPKKPPRTFAHVAVKKLKASSSAMLLSQSPASVQGKVSDALPLGVLKHARSKTESQILLRKLENAIGSNQSANVNSNKKTVPSDQNFSPNCVNGERDNKNNLRQDISSEVRCGHAQKFSNRTLKDQTAAQLNTCFSSLSCGDSGVYSKITTSDSNSSEVVQTMDCKPVSNGDVKQKFYGTLHKANSEEHIYAEPYEHMNKGDGSDDKLKRSLFSEKETTNAGREDVLSSNIFSRPKSSPQSNVATPGLHYLCSPIHESLSGQGGEMQARSLPIPFEAVNRELVGLMGPNSLPVDTSRAMAQPASHRGSSSAPHRGAAESTDPEQPLNPTKIKLLMNQAFGSPLQRLPAAAVGVDSSDSDSVASTPDEASSAPAMPASALPKPASRTSAGNANVVKEIRRPSVPPPDIPEMSKETLQQLTAERRVYIRRVSSHAMSTRSRRMSERGPVSSGSHLFDCLLLVGVNLDPERPKCKVPYIKSKYPPDAEAPAHIEDLCFPDASDWPPPVSEPEAGAMPGEEQCYSLVLTKDTGERKYGYCRRVQPEGASLCLPLAYCLLTSHRASGFYYKVLAELESRHGQPEALRSAFIKELFACGFANPGQAIRVHTGDGSVSPGCAGGSSSSYVQIKRQYDPRLEERDLSRLYGTLQVPVLLKVFGSVLLERKVLFISSSISKLSACVEALESCLYPFSWHHTFIPVLPASMLEVCSAPTPYIIGVLRGKVPRTLPQIEHGIAVDLDSSSIIQSMQDEMTILPANMNRNLRDALQLVLSSTTASESSRNVVVSESFVRLFVEVCGHYQNHIVVQQDGKKVFEKESFIKAVPSRYTQSFLEWFTETTMFSAFLDSRLEKPGETKGMFEQRVAEHCEERDRNTSLYLKNYRVLNKKKTLGDRFKDWTPF